MVTFSLRRTTVYFVSKYFEVKSLSTRQQDEKLLCLPDLCGLFLKIWKAKFNFYSDAQRFTSCRLQVEKSTLNPSEPT